tara:strand:- start:1046 stop:1759 length:714 start_codon:yes stop_codon:yes gene_type:complete
VKYILLVLSLFDYINKKKIVNFFKKNLLEINVFIDVGAHKGETVELFSKNFKVNKFYCFEASFINFENLKKKILNLKNQNIKFFNCAIGEEENIRNFYQLDESSSSTLTQINKDSDYYKKKMKILNLLNMKKKLIKTNKVKTITLSKFIKENNINNIDILKIDTEGYEYKVLNGAREEISKIKYIYFEHHFDDMLIKGYNLSDIHNYLVKKGFEKRFKLKMFFRKSFEYIYFNKNKI